MALAAIVKKYLELAGVFDAPLALSRLGLPQSEVESIFSMWDEDYQISRFMELSRQDGTGENTQVFIVNGYQATHVAFHEGIKRMAGLEPE